MEPRFGLKLTVHFCLVVSWKFFYAALHNTNNIGDRDVESSARGRNARDDRSYVRPGTRPSIRGLRIHAGRSARTDCHVGSHRAPEGRAKAHAGAAEVLACR